MVLPWSVVFVPGSGPVGVLDVDGGIGLLPFNGAGDKGMTDGLGLVLSSLRILGLDSA